jgi:hypothetical protein
VKIVLEEEASTTETGPLRALREQFDFDCLLFDTALLAYWRAAGQPFQVERRSRLAGSSVLKALDVDASLADLPLQLAVSISLPARFAVAVYEALSREARKLRYYQKEEFQEIDDLRNEPGALRRGLPHYLGLDIQRRLTSSSAPLVVFYDSYDKQAPQTIASRGVWLQELIATLDRGLHVISTREPLGWPAEEWAAIIQEMPVGSLPEPQARQLLKARFGDLPSAIAEHILKASGRMPFFLQAIGEAYELLAAGGAPVTADDLPSSTRDALPVLIEHLAPEQRRLAVTLAAVQVFDEQLFRYLLHTLNLQVDVFEFGPFTERFFVERIAPEPYELHKTHDLLSTSVHESGDEHIMRASLEAATDHLLMRCHDSSAGAHRTVLTLFLAVSSGWRSTRSMPVRCVEAIVDVGYLLYDAGYWSELAAILPSQPGHEEHPIDVVCRFFGALAARRITGIGPAREQLQWLAVDASALGRHERSLELEIAYLRELAGDYRRARAEFRRLDQRSGHFDPTDRTHLRARLWHADMLIMDGELQEGSRLLLETYELSGLAAPLDWAEFVRHRAHAFRFSFLPEQAEALYLEAKRAARGAPAFEGKLQTNLAEALCWCDPDRSLDAARLSTEANQQLGNSIELAKCEAARAIALGKLGEHASARDAVAKASLYATAVGYRAGVAFALQAEAVVEGIAGNVQAALAAGAQLGQVVAELNTYSHLRVAPAWLAATPRSLAGANIEVQWLQAGGLEQRLGQYLKAGGRV